MAHTEWVLEALTELGLDPATALRTGVAFIGYIRGMAMSVEPERQAEQDTGMSSQEWMDAHEATFAPLTARFPTLTRLSQTPDVDMGLDAIFESGLRCFLDGLNHRAQFSNDRHGTPAVRPVTWAPRVSAGTPGLAAAFAR